MRVADFVTRRAARRWCDELIQRQVRERQDLTAEFEVVTRQGERRVLEVSTCLIERDGAPVEIQGIARDVTERKEQEQALRSLTIIDDLTKLYNRRGFLTLAERHLKLAVRKKTGVFLLFADLDGLKIINDTFGHLEGDRALIDAADILRASFRSADIIARLGGDEFTVFPIEAAAESAVDPDRPARRARCSATTTPTSRAGTGWRSASASPASSPTAPGASTSCSSTPTRRSTSRSDCGRAVTLRRASAPRRASALQSTDVHRQRRRAASVRWPTPAPSSSSPASGLSPSSGSCCRSSAIRACRRTSRTATCAWPAAW